MAQTLQIGAGVQTAGSASVSAVHTNPASGSLSNNPTISGIGMHQPNIQPHGAGLVPVQGQQTTNVTNPSLNTHHATGQATGNTQRPQPSLPYITKGMKDHEPWI